MHLFLTFSLLLTISVAFVVMGTVIVFRTDIYSRWVRSSKNRLPLTCLRPAWAEDEQYGWRVKTVGLAFILFGVTAVILSVWICWFQK